MQDRATAGATGRVFRLFVFIYLFDVFVLYFPISDLPMMCQKRILNGSKMGKMVKIAAPLIPVFRRLLNPRQALLPTPVGEFFLLFEFEFDVSLILSLHFRSN